MVLQVKIKVVDRITRLDKDCGVHSKNATSRELDYCLAVMKLVAAIDLFTDSDAILITSLYAMHCGISAVYKIKTKIIGQPEV